MLGQTDRLQVTQRKVTALPIRFFFTFSPAVNSSLSSLFSGYPSIITIDLGKTQYPGHQL